MKSNRFASSLALAAVAAFMWILPAEAARSAAPIKAMEGSPSEFKIMLSAKSAKKGTATFNVMNMGTLPHDFKIAGKKTPLIQPGKTAKLTVKFSKAGKYAYLCTVSGHAAAGMKGTLVVK